MQREGLKKYLDGLFERAIASRKRIQGDWPLSSVHRNANIAAIKGGACAVPVGDNRILCRVLNRYKMFVDATDKSLAPHLMLDGYWEMWVTEQISQMVKPGMTCVDVGANLGYFTLLMADLVESRGRVYAFEPNPPIAALLADSVTVNGFNDRVEILSCLLEDRNDAYMQLSVPEGYAGGATMLPPIPGQDIRTLFMTKRMDSFPELVEADVIKIDAEGAEYSIWKGMTEILERGRPLTVFLEFVACRYQEPAEFLSKLRGAGMDLFYIDPSLGVLPTSIDAILNAPETREFMLLLKR
ncbi:MAG TPA: FkbM family methyltransferase [Nitrosospira sp.]|nr:FkbM family methyltransferase [Nitrosospira sp.]